jgi:tetratricopeptide (TPR) repeat protein
MYSIRDAAELFEVPEARLRYWAQTGFVGPSVRHKGRFYYDFADLIALKVAISLTDRGVPLARVRKNLVALRDRLPEVARPFAELRVCSDGEELVVVEDGAAWQPETGQLVMSFAVRQLSERVLLDRAPPTPLAPRRKDTDHDNAYACFTAALAAQDAGDAAGAEGLYRRALSLDGALAAAWTNLGNLLAARGERGGAREAYDKALALDPDQPEARYDLANLLAEVGEHDLAIAEYRRVAHTAPDFADTHFNLAVTLLAVGAAAQARRHLERYLELDDASSWSESAREILGRL